MLNNLNELINKRISRRDMIKGTAFITAGAVIPFEFFKRPLFNKTEYNKGLTPSANPGKNSLPFKPISPSTEDRLILPEGFEYKVIRKWGDKISDTEDFGFNNDFVAYLPIDYLNGGKNSEDGLLVVNHEFPSPLFVAGYTDEDFKNNKTKTKEQIEAERKCVGMSVFRVKRIKGEWQFVEDEKYNRRIDANTKIYLTGMAAGSPPVKDTANVRGTLANCSGGLTPWGTVLSGEENYQDYPNNSGWNYRWTDNNEPFTIEHYGWVVEIDPFDKTSAPRKHTNLGRFHHENIAVHITSGGRVAAYMGDDIINECVYKFISEKKYDAKNRDANFSIFDSGSLYTADFTNNKWQLVDISRDELKSKYLSQAEVLVNCAEAAKLAGGTECSRCEDIEIRPVDGSVFMSFTNNSSKKDYFGSIVRITEKNNDSGSLEFTWEVFATGGAASGFSCPDNLTFDNKGNLWVLCDIAAGSLNKGSQAPFKNNSLFMIPTQGENTGKAFQFASGPVECEFCGGNFTPDFSTMFLSVQHPGENSETIENPTSHWPDGGTDIPRPAVVAITGFK